MDSENSTEVVLGLGNNGPDRFERWFTIKVNKQSGQAFKLQASNTGDKEWITPE
jgi:hypothetical protein